MPASVHAIGPYRPRPIRSLELWEATGWRLKVIGIAARAERPSQALVEAAKRAAAGLLRERPTRHVHYGVGFLGVHEGEGENQVFLDRWINRNELMHDYWVSPTDRPGDLRTCDADHNSVCIWDLSVQWLEREAWIACVMNNPAGPDLEAYLARRIDVTL